MRSTNGYMLSHIFFGPVIVVEKVVVGSNVHSVLRTVTLKFYFKEFFLSVEKQDWEITDHQYYYQAQLFNKKKQYCDFVVRMCF